MTSMIEAANDKLFSDRTHNEHRLTRLARDESNMPKDKQPWQIAQSL